jgi:hypothetical protein
MAVLLVLALVSEDGFDILILSLMAASLWIIIVWRRDLRLRPVFKKAPETAVLYAVLFSAIIFGLGHGRSLDRLLTTGLLYGVPLAAVFAKRDWEHAIGAHYMINMIPWLMSYLEN